MNQLQKCAEILVECGYWTGFDGSSVPYEFPLVNDLNYCEPFADTLEGRQQRDVIKNYLRSTVELRNLWQRSLMPFSYMYDDCYEWDNLRIKWCIEELLQ